MEDKNNSLANGFGQFGIQSKYILRKTGEEVEVIDFNVEEKGARSPQDWVSYICADGTERIKENLNIAFDFKASDVLSKAMANIFKPSAFSKLSLPSPWASRKIELLCAFIRAGYGWRESIVNTNSMVEELKKDPDFQEKEEENDD